MLGVCAELSIDVSNLGTDEDVEIVGNVVERGVGDPRWMESAGCPFASNNRVRRFGEGAWSIEQVADLAQASWIRLVGATDGQAVLFVAASGFAFPELDYTDGYRGQLHTETQTFSPVSNSLELRNAEGELVLWIGSAGSVAKLQPPPELQLSQGAIQNEMSRRDQCVPSWNEYRLEVSAGGAQVTIPHHERAIVGPWQVTNGGIELQSGPSGCPDAYVASALVAVWPSALSVPVTAGIGGPCDPAQLAASTLADRRLVCERTEQRPQGYLTLPCTVTEDCPAESICDGSFCRAP